MRFVSVVDDYGRRLDQSPFRPRAEVSFPRARQFSEYNGKEASASREKHRDKPIGSREPQCSSCTIHCELG